MEKIVFDGRDAAKPIRNDPTIKPFLAESDDARTGTVTLKDNTPERVVDEVTGEAAESREKEAEKYGQVPLSDRERDAIDFTETSVPAARAVKGIATGKGVDDFLAYFDETLTVDENREVFDNARKEGGGARNEGRETGTNAQRLAQANQRRKAEQGGRVRNYALVEQDTSAQQELQSQDGGVGDTFDIGFSQTDGRLEGSGEDFGRLTERHENRSERAQSVDEQRSAKVTRNPIQWTNNPDKYDFPGIDTIEPQDLHEQRSEAAQTLDEQQIAPTAETKQQWAQNPGRYDWPGVDRPEQYGPTGDTPLPAAERDRPEESRGPEVADSPAAELPAFDRESRRDGPRPSSARLSQSAFSDLASDEEADMAFTQAEEGRGGQGGAFTDDRPENSQLLDFGMETDATQNRESREDVERASVFGIDDRS